MPLNKTQDFLYFQNKASHYHNLHKAKSRIDSKLPETLRNTIDYHDIKHHDKHLPHLREFQIKFSNQTMLKRILSTDKSPINKHDTYARYNNFERSFRHKNPQKSQQQRLIEIQNKKLKKSIETARAMVGSIDNWKKNYDQNIKHSRLISKFAGQKLKDQLIIEIQKFLPEKYLKYLQHAQLQNSQQKSESRQKKIGKIHVDKLFILPQFQTPKTQLNNSNFKSKLTPSQRKSPQSRQNLQNLFQSNQISN